MRTFWLYIIASRSRVLYVGVTNDLFRRLREHKLGEASGFTQKYHVNRLVHCEETDDIEAAIAREKEIKAWRRSKKSRLQRRRIQRGLISAKIGLAAIEQK